MEQPETDLFIMVNVDHNNTLLAKWKPLIFFDVTHGGLYNPIEDLIFEIKPEKERNQGKTSKSRNIRLYQDGKPSTGGQWHYDLESAFTRAEYVASAYIYRRKYIIENEHKMVRYIR